MLRHVVAMLGLWMGAAPLHADMCNPEQVVCLERKDVLVDGRMLRDVCTRVHRVDTCVRTGETDACAPFAAVAVSTSDGLDEGQCIQTRETCLRYANGQCDTWDREYTCLNGPTDAPDAELLVRRYVNFAETVSSACAPLQRDLSCHFVDSRITQGAGLRTINTYDVTRHWWQRRQRFECIPDIGVEDTCAQVTSDPVCTEQGIPVCSRFDAQGACLVWQRAFHCYADPSLDAACQDINVCEGENCTGAPEDPSGDYGNAAAWLNFLDQAAKQNTCTNDAADPVYEGDEPDVDHCENNVLDYGNRVPEVFKGRRMTCERGLFNCCDNDFEGSCSASEIELTHYRIGKQTRFLGSECVSRFFGMCIKVREYHCVYNTKFARVFQEQADRQTGQQFNAARSPHCPGLTIAQLETIDVTRMDLREVFGDMLDNATRPVQQLVIERLNQDMGLFDSQVRETLQ